MEQNLMYDCLSHSEHGPTFFSGAKKGIATYIDKIFIPRCCIEQVNMKCIPWPRSGRRVQHIRSAQLVDHIPVVMSMYMNTHKMIQRMPPKIDRNLVSRCLMQGYKRHTFFRSIDHHMEQKTHEWQNAQATESPTKMYHVLRSVVNDSCEQ
eukprot:10982273-Karenia_brevis.AAC.1